METEASLQFVKATTLEYDSVRTAVTLQLTLPSGDKLLTTPYSSANSLAAAARKGLASNGFSEADLLGFLSSRLADWEVKTELARTDPREAPVVDLDTVTSELDDIKNSVVSPFEADNLFPSVYRVTESACIVRGGDVFNVLTLRLVVVLRHTAPATARAGCPNRGVLQSTPLLPLSHITNVAGSQHASRGCAAGTVWPSPQPRPAILGSQPEYSAAPPSAAPPASCMPGPSTGSQRMPATKITGEAIVKALSDLAAKAAPTPDDVEAAEPAYLAALREVKNRYNAFLAEGTKYFPDGSDGRGPLRQKDADPEAQRGKGAMKDGGHDRLLSEDDKTRARLWCVAGLAGTGHLLISIFRLNTSFPLRLLKLCLKVQPYFAARCEKTVDFNSAVSAHKSKVNGKPSEAFSNHKKAKKAGDEQWQSDKAMKAAELLAAWDKDIRPALEYASKKLPWSTLVEHRAGLEQAKTELDAATFDTHREIGTRILVGLCGSVKEVVQFMEDSNITVEPLAKSIFKVKKETRAAGEAAAMDAAVTAAVAL